MPVAISANGMTTYRGDAPSTEVWAGTTQGIEVLHRDGLGATWRRGARLLDGVHVGSIYVEPVRGGIFVGGHYESGMWRSLDGGTTWDDVTNGFATRHIYTVTSTVEDGQPSLYAGIEPAALYRSRDYGQTWVERPALRDVPGRDHWTFPAPPHDAHLKSIVFDPSDNRRVIGCVEQGGLYVSEDAGESWCYVENWEVPDTDRRVYKDCHRVLFHPSNPDGMYLIGGDGIHYTPDRLRTWEHFDTRTLGVAYPDHIVMHPDDDKLMWIAGTATNPNMWRDNKDADSKAMRSHDGGRTWELTLNGWPEHMRAAVEGTSLHVSPQAISIFTGNTDGEIWVSDDAGDSWYLAAAGLPPISKGRHYRNLLQNLTSPDLATA